MPRAALALILSIPVVVSPPIGAEANPHPRPDRRVERPAGAGSGTDAPRPTPAVEAAYRSHRFAPMGDPPARFATDQVWGSSSPTIVVLSEPRGTRAIRPLSVSPVDPNAVVGRTPSGRIFIGPAPGAYVARPEEVAHYRRMSQPYAPPSFQFLGTPSTRHMSGAVKLSHGVKPPDSLPTGPKVVWLDGRGSEAPTPGASPHVKHLK